MTNIDRWKAAFEAMDDRAQNELLLMAEAAARAHPRLQEKRLALVASNMIAIRSAQRLGQTEHIGTATLVGAAK